MQAPATLTPTVRILPANFLSPALLCDRISEPQSPSSIRTTHYPRNHHGLGNLSDSLRQGVGGKWYVTSRLLFPQAGLPLALNPGGHSRRDFFFLLSRLG
jgi:hypothetical protein